MNTIGDILTLQKTAQSIDQGMGVAGYPEGPAFSRRMQALVKTTFRSVEPTSPVEAKVDLQTMCARLGGANQDQELSVDAQGHYDCAIAILLTLDNGTDIEIISGLSRAQIYRRVGLLK